MDGRGETGLTRPSARRLSVIGDVLRTATRPPVALGLLEQHLEDRPVVTDAFDVGAMMTIKSNSLSDPILEQAEFVEMRSRLGLRE